MDYRGELRGTETVEELRTILENQDSYRPEFVALVAEELHQRDAMQAATPDTTPPIEELQRVANYRFVRNTVRPNGVGTIVFGIIAIAMGFSSIRVHPLNAVLGLIGIFLLVEGIWVYFSPTPKGMILNAVALLVVGIWNILVAIASLAEGAPPTVAIIGPLQIYWSFQSYGQYRRFAAMPTTKPPHETLRYIDDLVKTIAKARAKKQTDILEFRVKAFQGQAFWKAMLSDDCAILVERPGRQVVFATRNDVDIVREGKVLIGKTLKASIRLRDQKLTGIIAPEMLDRFETWKAGAGGTESSAVVGTTDSSAIGVP